MGLKGIGKGFVSGDIEKAKMKKYYALLLLIFLACGKISAQTAEISNVNISYDRYKNELKGLEIQFELHVHDCKDRPVEVVAFFYDKDADSNRTSNIGDYSGYKATNGETASWKTTTPKYDNSRWESFSLFLPYAALKHKAGRNNYSFQIHVRGPQDNPNTEYKDIHRTSYIDFSVSWPESPASGHSHTSTTNTNTTSTSNKYPYTETITTATGETSTTYYQDGRVEVISTINCGGCAHTGKCSICGGSGYTFFMNMSYPCPICCGLGRCPYCHGAGKTVSSYSYNRNVPAAGPISSGGAVNNSGASSSYSGSSSSSSTRRKCPGCGGSGKGIDRIEWATNYTGQDNTKWCPECGAYKHAHVHIHEPCRVCYGKGYVE